MSSTTETALMSLLAPLSGQAVPLEQVPDDVFSQKILGDGIAIIPADGKLYAPVDGEIASMVDDSDIAFFFHPECKSIGVFGQIQPGSVVAIAVIGVKIILERLKSIGTNKRFKDDHVLGILPESVGGIQGMTGGNSKFSRHL